MTVLFKTRIYDVIAFRNEILARTSAKNILGAWTLAKNQGCSRFWKGKFRQIDSFRWIVFRTINHFRWIDIKSPMSLFTFNFCRNTKKVFLPPKITENQRKELIEQLWREARNEMWLVRHKHEVSALVWNFALFFLGHSWKCTNTRDTVTGSWERKRGRLWLQES